MSCSDGEWGKVKDIATYASVSNGTVEKWLKIGLRYIQMPSGLRRIKCKDVDEFLEGFGNPGDQLNQAVNEMASEFSSLKPKISLTKQKAKSTKQNASA